MPRITPAEARETLRRCGVTIPAPSFHALCTDVVERLIVEADARRYRAPKNANGSRARYFFAMLERIASRKVVESSGRRRKFLAVRERKTALRRLPWAVTARKVDGGFIAFESEADAVAWSGEN